jgi:hydrogenase maturation protease
MSKKIIVIGYGNPSRSDDGLGWHAAKRLSEESSSSQLEILTLHQLTPDLAEPLSRAARVVFIDASVEGEPATLRSRRVGPGGPPPSAFGHHLTPDTLIALSGVLYGRAPEAFAFSVTGVSFDFGDTLSPGVEAVLPLMIEQVRECLERIP